MTNSVAPLPGKALVVFDDARGLLSDVFPCADGHAQERSLLDEVAETIQSNELWIADRNFCVTAFSAMAAVGAWMRLRIWMRVRMRVVGRACGSAWFVSVAGFGH